MLNDLPPRFARRIGTEGRRAVCADHRLVRDVQRFVRDVQLRAADVAPVIERMRRLEADALGRG